MSWQDLFKFNPWKFSLVTFLQVSEGIGEVLFAYILTLQFDAIRSRNLSLFLIYVVVEFICYTYVYVAFQLATIIWQRLQQQYFHLVRQEISDHYFEDGKHHRPSDVQNHLTNDFNLIHSDYFDSLGYIMSMVASVASVAISLLSFQWSLLVACLIFAAVQIYLPKLLDKRLQKAVSNVSVANKKYLKTLGDWLIGLSEIRRYCASHKFFNIVAQSSSELEQANVKKQKVDQELDYLNQLAYSIGDALIFLLTGFLVVNHLAAFGLIASIGNFNSSLFGSLQGIANYTGRMRSTKKLRRDIFINRKKIVPKENNDLSVAKSFAIHDLAINFENGESVSYPDFKVKSGEKILLTGDSGTGKSTLLKLILGEVKPSHGKIEYFDKDNNQIHPDFSEIGYLPQNPTLFPASIVDNITMFDQKLRKFVAPAINQVQLANDIAKFPDKENTQINLDKLNISGGQRQKIVLARNRIHASQLLLIDEATSAIDQKSTLKILKEIVRGDATVVFIAHNFNKEMHKLFDREISLNK